MTAKQREAFASTRSNLLADLRRAAMFSPPAPIPTRAAAAFCRS